MLKCDERVANVNESIGDENRDSGVDGRRAITKSITKTHKAYIFGIPRDAVTNRSAKKPNR